MPPGLWLGLSWRTGHGPLGGEPAGLALSSELGTGKGDRPTWPSHSPAVAGAQGVQPVAPTLGATLAAAVTCSYDRPLGPVSVLLPSRGPAPEAGPARAGGTAPSWPPPAMGGSCLCILQFGSHSTDVWGRPPLPLPLLSAWPSPARVSTVPTGREEGSARARAPPQLWSRPQPGREHSALPGEQRTSRALGSGIGPPVP